MGGEEVRTVPLDLGRGEAEGRGKVRGEERRGEGRYIRGERGREEVRDNKKEEWLVTRDGQLYKTESLTILPKM